MELTCFAAKGGLDKASRSHTRFRAYADVRGSEASAMAQGVGNDLAGV